MNEAILEISDITCGYHNTNVIENMSFKIEKGDFFGVIGPNGSGKSTLLRAMSKALTLKNGTISFEGKNISNIKIKDFSKSAAFVPQDTFINFPFTVTEVVLMGRIPHLGRLQFETKKDTQIAHEALITTDALHLKDKLINELSAGERQRVIIAKALTQKPKLLFLDEPTSHLDISHQIKILQLLKELNAKEKLTIVIVLHDLNLAGEYCRSIMLMDKGRKFREGSPEEVITYQNIEEVYGCVVVVKNNPISKKPYVIAVSKQTCRQN